MEQLVSAELERRIVATLTPAGENRLLPSVLVSRILCSGRTSTPPKEVYEQTDYHYPTGNRTSN